MEPTIWKQGAARLWDEHSKLPFAGVTSWFSRVCFKSDSTGTQRITKRFLVTFSRLSQFLIHNRGFPTFASRPICDWDAWTSNDAASINHLSSHFNKLHTLTRGSFNFFHSNSQVPYDDGEIEESIALRTTFLHYFSIWNYFSSRNFFTNASFRHTENFILLLQANSVWSIDVCSNKVEPSHFVVGYSIPRCMGQRHLTTPTSAAPVETEVTHAGNNNKYWRCTDAIE